MPIPGYDSSIRGPYQKKIVSRDKGAPREYIANNVVPSEVSHYRIDGYVITSGVRCDFILMNESKSVAYLIELKGGNMTHAAKQLEATEQVLKSQLAPYQLRYRIVTSKSCTHQIQSSYFLGFRARKGNNLCYRTNQIEEDI